MSFVKSPGEWAWPYKIEFYDAEMLLVAWETTPEIIARLLPPPLRQGKQSIATAFIADYPRTNFGVTYREAALFLPAAFGDEEGMHCLAMPVTDDMAMIGGREIFGFPKKIATIEWVHEGQDVRGWVERHGVRYFEVKANLNGQFNSADAQQVFAEALPFQEGKAIGTAYNFKYFPAPEGTGFEYAPRLIRQQNELRPSAFGVGQAEVVLRSSPQDPWAEIPIVRILGAIYLRGNNTMLPGEVIAETNAEAFAPYAGIKYDF